MDRTVHRARPIVVPLHGIEDSDSDVLEIFPDELPQESAASVVEILNNEKASLSVWRELVIAYGRKKLFSCVEDVAFAATTAWHNNSDWHVQEKQRNDYLFILVARATAAVYSVASSQTLANRAQRSAITAAFNKAQECLIDARAIDADNTLIKSTMGLIHLVRAQLERADSVVDESRRRHAADQAAQYLGNARHQFSDANATHKHVVKQLRSAYTLSNDEGIAIPGSVHITATVGEGCAAFHQGDYTHARNCFASAIRAHPNAPASLRVALGLSLQKLGHDSAAELAFKRALQMQPDNVDALVLYATLLRMNARQPSLDPMDQEGLNRRAIALLQRAFELDTTSGRALNHLSMHYFTTFSSISTDGSLISDSTDATAAVTAKGVKYGYSLSLSAPVARSFTKGELLRLTTFESSSETEEVFVQVLKITGPQEVVLRSPFMGSTNSKFVVARRDASNALRLARTSSECSVDPGVKCEGHFLAGRIYHVSGQYIDAATEYKRSLSCNKDFLPAKFALAQCMLQQSKEDEAERLLKSIITGQPENGDALRLMCAIQLLRAMKVHNDMSYKPARHLFEACASSLAKRHDGSRAKQPKSVLASGLPAPTKPEMEKWLRLDAARYASRATEASPRDSDAWLQLAILQQESSHAIVSKQACDAYEKAIKELNFRNEGVPFELWNNFAVMLMRQNQLDQARRAFSRATRTAAPLALPASELVEKDDEDFSQNDGVLYRPVVVTVAFNLGCLTERMGDIFAAKKMYARILQYHPQYFEARLRLATLSFHSGDYNAAEQWCIRALYSCQVNPEEIKVVRLQPLQEFPSETLSLSELSNFAVRQGLSAAETSRCRAAALCILSRSLLRRGKRKQALAALDFVLQLPGHSMDSYASLWRANLVFDGVYRNSDAQRETTLRNAFNEYKGIMRRNPSNVYAANGLACVLAEQGRLEYAQDVLKAIRVADQDVMPSAINLAHTLLVTGAHHQAAQLYKHILQKFLGGGLKRASTPSSSSGSCESFCNVAADSMRIVIILGLARAFLVGKQFNDCIWVLRVAIRWAPQDLRLWFNLAFARGEEAVRILGISPDSRQLDDVINAVEHLRGALDTFKTLETIAENVADQAEAVVKQQWYESNGTEKEGAENPVLVSKIAEARAVAMSVEQLGFSAKAVERCATHCQRMLAPAEQHLVDAKVRHERKQAEHQQRLDELAALRRAREEKKQVEQLRIQEEKEDTQARARALAGTLLDHQEQWKMQEASKEASKRAKKKLDKIATARRMIDTSVQTWSAAESEDLLDGWVMTDSRRAAFRRAALASGFDESKPDNDIIQDLFGNSDDEEELDTDVASDNVGLSSGDIESIFELLSEAQAFPDTAEQNDDTALNEIFNEFAGDSDDSSVDESSERRAFKRRHTSSESDNGNKRSRLEE